MITTWKYRESLLSTGLFVAYNDVFKAKKANIALKMKPIMLFMVVKK